MVGKIKKEFIEEIVKKFGSKYPKETEYVESKIGRYAGDGDLIAIDLRFLNEKIYDELIKLCKADIKGKGSNYLIQNITSLRRINENPSGTVVKQLHTLEAALKLYLKESHYYYLFKRSEDGFDLPYLVTKIEYNPARKDRDYYVPASVSVDLVYNRMDQTKTNKISFSSGNVTSGNKDGKNVKQLLREKGYYIATGDIIKSYEEEVEYYHKVRKDIGNQYVGTGMAVTRNDRWRNDRWGSDWITIYNGLENKQYKLVVDIYEASGSRNTMVYTNEWDATPSGENKSYPIPVHPYVCVYDIDRYIELEVHACSIKRYVYDKKLIEKLILPEEHIELITTLVESRKDIMEDVVRGKTGGIIVLATGIPGTGKTLTAEIYSEFVERPLYKIQSSQLGVTPDNLEKRLKEVLEKASRWDAVLLIDEADVFIHERGDDIVQNAIVGVFLRVLEYYNGVLFMTSNRATIIDDAIESRATAHIAYDIPPTDDAKQIWRILADQFKVEISDKLISDLVKKYPTLVGRDIKGLLKLGKIVAKRKNKGVVNMEIIDAVTKFKKINHVEK